MLLTGCIPSRSDLCSRRGPVTAPCHPQVTGATAAALPLGQRDVSCCCMAQGPALLQWLTQKQAPCPALANENCQLGLWNLQYADQSYARRLIGASLFAALGRDWAGAHSDRLGHAWMAVAHCSAGYPWQDTHQAALHETGTCCRKLLGIMVCPHELAISLAQVNTSPSPLLLANVLRDNIPGRHTKLQVQKDCWHCQHVALQVDPFEVYL